MEKILYYEKTLRDEPSEWIVLLHGLGGNILSLKYQIREYSKYYNTIAIELPGHGNSRQPTAPKEYVMEDIVAEIVAVMDECGVERAHFMAVSLSSIIAVGLAATYPGRVISMVQGSGILRFELGMRIFAPPAIWLCKFVSYYTVYKLFARIIIPGKKHAFARRVFVKGAAKMGGDEFCAWVRFMFGNSCLGEYTDKLNLLPTPIPQLYIMGEEDFLFKRFTPRLVSRIKGADTIFLENAGHICNIEQRREFNRISLEFFEKNSI